MRGQGGELGLCAVPCAISVLMIGRRETRQVVRTACLWPGPGKSFAPKGLASYDCADLVAVDVDVPRLDPLRYMLHPVVDPGV